MVGMHIDLAQKEKCMYIDYRGSNVSSRNPPELEFHFAYPWFETCHFTHLRIKTLAAVTHLTPFR
jgi:hypothetical protein